MTTDSIARSVRTILLSDWDPIGIAGIPQAADEYDGYVADIAQMVEAGSAVSTLAKHLMMIEVERMGLSGNANRAQSVAAKLKSIARDSPA